MIRNTMRRAVTGVSVLLFAFALVVLVAGDSSIPPGVRQQLAAAEPTIVIGIVAWSGAILWLDRARRRAPRPAVDWRSQSTESASRESQTVGSRWQESFDVASSASASRSDRREARDTIEDELKTIAVERVRLVNDVSEEQATATVNAGDWTTDRRAAALLGGPDAPSPSILVRVYDLCSSEGVYERQVRHATRAIDSIDDDTEGSK